MAEALPPPEERLINTCKDSLPYTEETTCPVCHQLMSSPRQLSCEDTMCHSCVGTDLTKVVEDDIVQCPVCSDKSTVPSGGIRKMRNNEVERLLEIRSALAVDVTGMTCQDEKCGKRPRRVSSEDEDEDIPERVGERESAVGRFAARVAKMSRGDDARPQPPPRSSDKRRMDSPSDEDDGDAKGDIDTTSAQEAMKHEDSAEGRNPASGESPKKADAPSAASACLPDAPAADSNAVQEYCLTCSMFLCLGCSQAHDEEDRPHATIPLRELTEEERRTVTKRHPPRCYDHPEVLYSLYCKDCKETLCVTCVEVDDHEGHNVLDLRVAAEESRENIRRIQREVEEYQKNLAVVIAESDANYERANRDIEMMRQMIIDEVQRLQDYINQQEREMLAMIDRRRAASRFRRGDPNQGRKL